MPSLLRIFPASIAIGACVLVLASACGDERAKFAVSYAPTFQKEAPKISVFGVFRDGRMNPEAWEDLTPRFRTVLHGDTCDAAIGNSLRVLNPPLFSATDNVARRAGISDELLEKFAPAAEGDEVLVIMVSGKPPGARDGGETGFSTDQPGQQGMNSGRGGAGRRGGGQMVPRSYGIPSGRFEVNAWLYSKREKKSVFQQSLVYAGVSEADAFARFVEKLGESLPGAICAGWKADLGVDAHTIEDMKEE